MNEKTATVFCPSCGMLLGDNVEAGVIKCNYCGRKCTDPSFSHRVIERTKIVSFKQKRKNIELENTNNAEIDRKCTRCGNETLMFATAQLRNADEGQTVFYKCRKCGLTFAENT